MTTVQGIRFDAVRLTASSESNPRDLGIEQIDTLQIHHATTKSLSGLEANMDPGGRTVSATGALSSGAERADGKAQLVYKVALNRRPFTSASQTDERSFTVETCNTSYDPDWGISRASHERLAELLLDLHDRFGVPLKRGLPGVIGHNEVPGTYPTACPGPSMDLDWIVGRAKTMKAAREAAESDEDMPARTRITAEIDTPVGASFKTLRLNKAGDASLAIGPARVDVVANVRARNLVQPTFEPGEVAPSPENGDVITPAAFEAPVVQARFIRYVPTGAVEHSEGVGLEMIGTAGSTFGQLVGQIDLAKGERLRIQAMTTGENVNVSFDATLRVQKL